MAQKPGPKLGLLRHVSYFTSLTDNLLTELAAVALERRYPRGQVIFLEGDPCVGLYVVGTGQVKIYKLSSQGREHILHQLGPGGTFNDVPALDGGPNPASAAAVTDVLLWIIPRADLRRLAHAYPELAWALIESIARRTRHLVAMVEDLALRSVKARLAKLLLAKAEEVAGLPEIQRDQMVSQAEMAAQLGTVREMIGRALRELSDEGLITFDRHRIVITDRDSLAAVVDM